MRQLILATLIVGCLVSTGFAQAPVAADAHVVAGTSTNAGASKQLQLSALSGKIPASDVYLRLDLSRLPAGATADAVTKATLRLHVLPNSSSFGTFDVYLVMSSWDEYSIADDLRPARGPLLFTGVAVRQRGSYLVLDITGPVKAWLSGAAANHGILLTPSTGISNALNVFLDSKEGGGHDAEIQIDYTDQAVTDALTAQEARLSQEVLDRQDADASTLALATAHTNQQVVAEATTRASADDALAAALQGEISRATSVEAALNGALANYARLDLANTFAGTQKFNSRLAVGLLPVVNDTWVNIGSNQDMIAGAFVNDHNLGGRPALFALHTGLGHAIHARNTQGGGRAGFFEATHGLNQAPALETRANGPGPALLATNANANGVGGQFQSAGKILSGRNAAAEVFSVSNSGQVTATGFAGDGSALTSVAARSASSAERATFADMAGSSAFAGFAADANQLAGASAEQYARRDQGNYFTETQNIAQDLYVGGVVSPRSVSVMTSDVIGVDSRTDAAGGVGVHAIVTATTGWTRGLFGRVDSPDGVALNLETHNGGTLIDAFAVGGGGFRVDSRGNVTASGVFSGDGSGLTNVTAATASQADTAGLAARADFATEAEFAGEAYNAAVAGFANQAGTANNALALGGASPASFARLDAPNVFNGASQKFNGNAAIGIHGLINEVWLNVGGNQDKTAGFFITNNQTTRDNLYLAHTGPGNVLHAESTQPGGGRAGLFEATHTTSMAPALETRVAGPAAAFLANASNANGTAGVFQSAGKILSGRNLSAEVFSVSNAGTVTATAFVGNGSGLTHVPAVPAYVDAFTGYFELSNSSSPLVLTKLLPASDYLLLSRINVTNTGTQQAAATCAFVVFDNEEGPPLGLDSSIVHLSPGEKSTVTLQEVIRVGHRVEVRCSGGQVVVWSANFTALQVSRR